MERITAYSGYKDFGVEWPGEAPDSELRDTEQIPLLEGGGIKAFLRREASLYASDAWYDPAKVKIGYEIRFTRCFYKPEPIRTLGKEPAGLLDEIIRKHV